MLYYFRMVNSPINNNEWEKIIKSFPEVPTLPVGYKGNKAEQMRYLNSIKPSLEKPFSKALISNKNISEAIYYATELGNESSLSALRSEQLRRIAPPFRPPEASRPNRPNEAGIPTKDVINNLLGKIYFSSPAKQAEAYHAFINIYLTDWVNRKGFNKNGLHYTYTPFANDAQFLTDIESYIENILKTQMLEKPNPGTTNKRVGNSIRQQYLKDILERIKKRRKLLMNEEFNRLTRSNRENVKTRKGGRKQKYKRMYTQRKN